MIEYDDPANNPFCKIPLRSQNNVEEKLVPYIYW